MTIAPGTHLGPYEITAKLGEGGMGEVYRARDTKLERNVAIKVLPAAFVEDHERLQRFEREAKLLAQLNHPNIAHIYGMEASSDSHALVMELVEGPTLAERLESGAIPLNESLLLARQIAEALEEAHEKGIIHRDLKPQNIKASIEGRVKVLDFGLAKAMDPVGAASGAGSASQLAQSPTLTLGATVQGVILGTAAYMAPEQARGLAVDRRADIWAFGVVLYELLTGSRLFEGELVTDVLANVLKHEVDLAALPASTPPPVRRLLRLCLERNSKNRLHDIADARLMIDEALLPGGGADGAETVPAAPAPSMRSLIPWTLAVLAAGALVGWFASRSAPGATESSPRLSLRRLTDLPGLESSPDLSPDGRTLVYSGAASGNKDIYVMRIDGGRAIDITPNSPSDDEQPAFSHDGQQIVFRSSRDGGGLFVMGATGESVRRLTDEGYDPAWSPDGTRIAYSMEAVVSPDSRKASTSLWVVDIATGEKRRLPPADAVQPAWSPDGKRIAYWANAAGQRDVWTIAVDGGDPVAITDDAPTDWSPEWSPDGRWLYISSDREGGMNLFRVPIDAATGAATGAPEPVTTSAGNLGWARFSADGRRMTAAAYETSSVVDLYRLTAGSEPQLRALRTIRSRTLHWCKVSPDAAWLACVTLGTPEDLVLLRTDGSELRRLTNDAYKDRNVSWSPDGSQLGFFSTRGGGWSEWMLRTDGSELRQLDDFWGTSTIGAWTADGRQLTMMLDWKKLVYLTPDHLTTLANAQTTPLPQSMQGFWPDAWSPSGLLLGGTEIDEAVRALSIGAVDLEHGIYHRSRLPVTGFGIWKFAGWLPDSRQYVANAGDQIALVDVESGDFQTLVPVDPSKLTVASLSRDGGTLVVETPVDDGDIWLLERKAKKEAGN